MPHNMFEELDAAAKTNLSPAGYARYLRYKAELCGPQQLTPNITQFRSAQDIEATLRGFIWSENKE
jgi:hypothetical protein